MSENNLWLSAESISTEWNDGPRLKACKIDDVINDVIVIALQHRCG